jgi:hypothetical protein
MNDVPYVKLTFLPEMVSEDSDGYVSVPVAIESWPPGLDVRSLLTYAIAALAAYDEEETDD